ncbi:EamA family transporter [Nicoliella lavandulae]|uniref:EamA family transporter n=1 Tax=Nicoliella lavandulae TaxID=3082954 RepID=A0ABU8SL79_9LACO
MNQKKGITFAVVGSICWGMSGTIAEYLFATQHVSPLWLVGLRLLVAGILLLAWSGIIKHESIFSIWQDRSARLPLIGFSLLGMLPSQLAYFMAIKYGNAPTATVLQFLGPIFIIGYLTIAHRSLPSRVDIVSVILAVIGTFLLVTKGHFDSLALSIAALAWGIGAGLSQASYTLLPRKLLARFDARLVVGWGMTIGSLPFTVVLVREPMPTLSFPVVASIFFIIIFGTMLAYLFYLNSVKYISPSATGMLSSFEPLTATVLSVTFLSTPLSFVQIIGGLFVIATVFVQTIFKHE